MAARRYVMRVAAALFLLCVIGCAAVRPHPRPPRAHAEDGWHEHLGALMLQVQDPRGYLLILNAFPFHLRIALLEHTGSVRGSGGRYRPIEEGSAGETVWNRRLDLLTFLNTARFVRHGYMGLRPVGMTRVPNPLRARCPGGLVRAATADLRGHNLLILETIAVPRDERYGCMYRFRYLID